MSEKRTRPPLTGEHDSFIARWSELKQASRRQVDPTDQSAASRVAEKPEPEPLCDADMPPIESLTEESDYRGFLSEGVSEALRQQALRKLFHSAAFNICDGLDDYAEDFAAFDKLGEIITAEMRHRMATAEERIESSMVAEETNVEPQSERDEQVQPQQLAPNESTTPITADNPGNRDRTES